MKISYDLKPIKISLLPPYGNKVREYRITLNHPIIFYDFRNKLYRLSDMIEASLKSGELETIIFASNEGLYLGHIDFKDNVDKYKFIGTDIDTIVENVMRIIKKFNLEQSLWG